MAGCRLCTSPGTWGVTLDLEWNRQRSVDEQLRIDRFPLMRPVSYERTEAFSEARGLEGHEGQNGLALSVNVCSGGVCLFLNLEAEQQEKMWVDVPIAVCGEKKTKLGGGGWERAVPLRRKG